MDGVAYCKRNGIRNTKKIKKWVDAGYLGDASKDEKTGKYIISKDVPVPFSANAKVSTFPTLMRDINGCDKRMFYLFINVSEYKARII